jgi:hypothetical protein
MFSISRWLFQRPGVAARAGPPGMAARPGPMAMRRPETGVPRGLPRRARLAPIFQVGFRCWRRQGRRTPSGRSRGPPDGRDSDCPRAAASKAPWRSAGRGPAAMFRALPKELARGGLCGPDCQPKPPPGRPGLGYRADVPICVPMPGDMGTGNIGTRAFCAAVTRAASRAAGQPPARGPANQPVGRSEGPPGHAGPRWRGQQGAQRATARCSMRPAPPPRSPCRTARPAGGRQ